MFWIRRFFLKLQSERTKPNTSEAVSFNLNRPQTGLPCDRACNSSITADHFYSVSAKKPMALWSSNQPTAIIFNFKASFGWIYSAVIVLQGKRSSPTSKRKMDQSDDLISAVRSFRYMLLKKAIDYGSSQSVSYTHLTLPTKRIV